MPEPLYCLTNNQKKRSSRAIIWTKTACQRKIELFSCGKKHILHRRLTCVSVEKCSQEEKKNCQKTQKIKKQKHKKKSQIVMRVKLFNRWVWETKFIGFLKLILFQATGHLKLISTQIHHHSAKSVRLKLERRWRVQSTMFCLNHDSRLV